MSDETDILLASEVAKMLRVDVKRVYMYISNGWLRATNVGTPKRKDWRIYREDFEEFKRNRNSYNS